MPSGRRSWSCETTLSGTVPCARTVNASGSTIATAGIWTSCSRPVSDCRMRSAQWHDRHFDWTFVLPCGLARETAPENPQRPGIPESPEPAGTRDGRDPRARDAAAGLPGRTDRAALLAGERAGGLHALQPLRRPSGSAVQPADTLRVATQREIRVRTAVGGPAMLQVERLRAEGR